MYARDISVWKNEEDWDGSTVECVVTKGGRFVNHGGRFALPAVVQRRIKAEVEGEAVVDGDLYEWLADPLEDDDEDDDLDELDDAEAIQAAHALRDFAEKVSRRVDAMADAARRFSCSPLAGDVVHLRDGSGMATVMSTSDKGASLWVKQGSREKRVSIMAVEGWGPAWLRKAWIDSYVAQLAPAPRRGAIRK